jgi:hypothetical protein
VEEDAFSEEDRSQGKQSSSGGRFNCGGGALLNSVDNPYTHTFQDISQPTGNKVETTTVLLNALCEALMKGQTIEHIPTSKKDLEVGNMLLKLFINNKEVLLAKTQHKLLNMEGVFAFVQGREDENNIALNKTDFVTHITKKLIDQVTLKDLVIRIPFPVKRLDDRVYMFIFQEGDEFVGEGGSTTNRGPEFPTPKISDAGPGCEEADMEEV